MADGHHTDWREAALAGFIERFPEIGNFDPTASWDDYLRVMGRSTPERFRKAADRLVEQQSFAPTVAKVREALEAVARAEERDKPEATWTESWLRDNPQFARYAVRDWLVERGKWPPTVPEPTSPFFGFDDAVQAEFERALDLVRIGNPGDITNAKRRISFDRLRLLAVHLGMESSVQRVLHEHKAQTAQNRSISDWTSAHIDSLVEFEARGYAIPFTVDQCRDELARRTA